MKIPKHLHIPVVIILIIFWFLVVLGGMSLLGYSVNISNGSIHIVTVNSENSKNTVNLPIPENVSNDSRASKTSFKQENTAAPETVNQPATQQTSTLSNGVSISRNIKYYPIYGRTLYEITDSLNTNGPKAYSPVEGGAISAHASTEPGFYPNIDCKGNFEVGLNITYTYPKWDRPTNATNEAILAFNSYLVNLEIHERGHEKLAAQAADEIIRMIKNIDTQIPCAEQNRIVRVSGGKIVDEHYAKQYEYDSVTQHGLTQGAYLYY